MSYKLHNVTVVNGYIRVHITSEGKMIPDKDLIAQVTPIRDARYPSPAFEMSFSYKNGTIDQTINTAWDPQTRLRAKVDVYLLKFPEGEETVEILTSDGGGGSGRTIPDPYRFLRRWFPFIKYPAPPIYRVIHR